MGERTRLVYGLRRIPVTDPAPVYPQSLLWHRDPAPGGRVERHRDRAGQPWPGRPPGARLPVASRACFGGVALRGGGDDGSERGPRQ